MTREQLADALALETAKIVKHRPGSNAETVVIELYDSFNLARYTIAKVIRENTPAQTEPEPAISLDMLMSVSK